MNIRYMIAVTAAILMSIIGTDAQVKIGGLEFDKNVHNFGTILHKSGPVSCSFNLKNVSEKPVVIYNVVTTCGCTDVEWTKEPISPGKSGRIKVTYSNDEGPYPFDKTITVYVSDSKKPILLKIRGISTEEEKPLDELYPISYGPLATDKTIFKCGNADQGEQKSDAVMVANISDRPVKVTFEDVSEHLSISVSPNPIPANSTAEMTFTVSTSKELWGKNIYWATPLCNGASHANHNGCKKIGVWMFTKQNFSHLTDDERDNGPKPVFRESTYSVNKVKKGEMIEAEFSYVNEGKKPFGVYKIDCDAVKWAHSSIPVAQPGERVTFKVKVDTSRLPVGELLTTVVLTTNSPLRPIVNLFIVGWIE